MNMLIEYRKCLESKLRKARSVKSNLTRMAEEAITDINRRAEAEKEVVSEMFTKLITMQEEEITQLREELGIGVKEHLTPEIVGQAIETLDKAIVPDDWPSKAILKFGATRPGIKKKGVKNVQPQV